MDFPGDSDSRESACNAGDASSIPGLGRSPQVENWQSTPVFLPGKFLGQRRLTGYSSWGHKELDTTKENPMDGGPGGLQSMGSLRVGHN